MKTLRTLVLAATMAASSSLGVAQLNLVDSRAAFPAGETVDWSILGPAFTTVSSPFTIATSGGGLMTVSHNPGSLFERRDQITGGWFGNFSFGDALLWNRGDNGSITFNPGGLISGAGFNVQSDFHGAFTFKLEAYDAGGGLLGSVTKNGYSDSEEGTAIFVGFTSASLNVDQFIATLVSATGGPSNFAINSLALASSAGPELPPGVTPVPEPSVYGLMGVLVILGLIGRERIRRHSEA